jgi:polar amino acid transport system substrate-binding protein
MLIAALALASAAPALAQSVPARIRDAGKIVIATNPNYAPITFKDPATNTLMGFDIDLGTAIAKELGVKIEWQEIAFAQMLPSLQTRRDAADFVDYMTSGPQFYTISALAGTIKTPEDLCGKSVGASRSTNWPAQMTEWSQTNCVAKGKPAMNVVGTEGSVDARTQLKTERLQGAVQGNETLPYFQALEPNTYVLLGTAFTQSLVGMPFAKSETALRDAVKAAIERLQASGEYDKMLAKYGLQANKLTPISINKGE